MAVAKALRESRSQKKKNTPRVEKKVSRRQKTFLSFPLNLTVPNLTSVTIPVTAEELGKRKICR